VCYAKPGVSIARTQCSNGSSALLAYALNPYLYELWYNRCVTSELRESGLIRLEARLGNTLAWVVPAWATLCGAVSSGRLALSSAPTLTLVTLLVEAGWGTVWGALATTDWAALLQGWNSWQGSDDPLSIPYTTPGSTGQRFGRWIAQLRSWWRNDPSPGQRSAIGTAIVGAAASVAFAIAIGPDILMLTLAGLALMQMAVLMNRGRGSAVAAWDAVLRLGLPWLAGHLTFEVLSLPSIALAIVFSLAVSGMGITRRWWAYALWIGGQVLATAVLVYLRLPLVVLLLALFLVPQWLLVVWLVPQEVDRGQDQWAHRAWPWLAAGMLVAALAL
jgi:hypothetical protein